MPGHAEGSVSFRATWFDAGDGIGNRSGGLHDPERDRGAFGEAGATEGGETAWL